MIKEVPLVEPLGQEPPYSSSFEIALMRECDSMVSRWSEKRESMACLRASRNTFKGKAIEESGGEFSFSSQSPEQRPIEYKAGCLEWYLESTWKAWAKRGNFRSVLPLRPMLRCAKRHTARLDEVTCISKYFVSDEYK